MNDPKSSNLKRAASPAAPVSGQVRARLAAAGHRFHANDNIAEFIRDGELDGARGRGERSGSRACSSRW